MWATHLALHSSFAKVLYAHIRGLEVPCLDVVVHEMYAAAQHESRVAEPPSDVDLTLGHAARRVDLLAQEVAAAKG